jgi:polysaccharide pyruvyl transferase WcaK-like protein
MSRTRMKIGLLNHLGGGNLGDDATLDAMMQNIKSRWPDCEIHAFSMNPSDTRVRHGVPAYALRFRTWSFGKAPEDRKVSARARMRGFGEKHKFLSVVASLVNAVAFRPARYIVNELIFLVRSYRVMQSFDLLVISGGGQLLDSWGGPWNFPYTVLKWVLLAKLSGAKCYFINVGAGPLHHPLTKWFVKGALHLSDYVSFRDDNSKRLINEIGFTAESHGVADCVYSLDLCVANPLTAPEQLIVGLSPMAYCDPRVYWKKNQELYAALIQNLACFGSWLTRRQYHVSLFSTDICFDAQTIEDLKCALKANLGDFGRPQITHTPIATVKQLLALMSSMDYIVTCRFHGVVFAHLLNKPVLALSHHPKVATLMSDLGLASYCVDIERANYDVLSETFASVVRNRDEIKRRMAETLLRYRKGLAVQFDSLFPTRSQYESR